ncbi:hypothetical protein O9H85_26550 [Paenibacillus filicis]|uniref:SMI1/KNR4 family protein n=1 Tax=Paenibacillus gyeongsangnamensis TaxID=3388067 RepID=A0ABT4QGB2_9BACL|nr:hypothetical protein [Paenibacillus filicis]MCZ8515894.1 hypothetical protein [Paenibacillus filicis]
MSASWQESKTVSSESLQERLQTIRPLQQEEHEQYEIAKDRLTGEHYLHYAYLHRNFAAVGPGAGEAEVFHHLMPIDNDEVLGLLFNDEPFLYPQHWTKPFLRNGPEGDYVWFDPSYVAEEEEDMAAAIRITEELARFREEGDYSEEAIKRLFERTNGKREQDS